LARLCADLNMKFEKCPKCGSEDLVDCWTNGRKLQQHCNSEDDWEESCGWKGEPRIPEQQKVSAIRTISVGPWCYHLFDKYGHSLSYSQGFGSQEETEEALFKELEKGMKNEEYGPYSGVVWPPSTVVRGVYYE
jgi:hypothetical protein